MPGRAAVAVGLLAALGASPVATAAPGQGFPRYSCTMPLSPEGNCSGEATIEASNGNLTCDGGLRDFRCDGWGSLRIKGRPYYNVLLRFGKPFEFSIEMPDGNLEECDNADPGTPILEGGRLNPPRCAGPTRVNEATLRVCNRTGEFAQVAWSRPVREKGTWETTGWFWAEPGTCRSLSSGSLGNRYYYYYAETEDRHPVTERRSGEKSIFCVNDGRFTTRSKEGEERQNCKGKGDRIEKFGIVDLNGAKSYVINLERIVRPAAAGAAPPPPRVPAPAPARTHSDVTDRDDPSSWSPEKQARYRAFERGMGSQ